MTRSALSVPSRELTFDEWVDSTRFSAGALNVAPTDISQFVRLDQCQRYLRLRLHEANGGPGFIDAIGAQAVKIPPMLTKSGRAFEERVEAEITAAMPTHKFKGSQAGRARSENDNRDVIDAARALAPGERIALLQPKLAAEVGGWRLSGLADLVLLEADSEGALEALVVDFKSSNAARLEHRLQVAIYRIMLRAVFADAGLLGVDLPIAILYRGGSSPEDNDENRRADAHETLSVTDALLERVEKPLELEAAAHDLLLGPDSLARRTLAEDFNTVPFHLSPTCDGCLYNEVCLKWCAQEDDLSLIPHLTAQDKTVLIKNGVTSAKSLAAVRTDDPALAARLSMTWPVGPRMDELIARAQRYRQSKGDDYRVGRSIPDSGHGSLPFCSADQNPNLVRVYIDVQHDYLNDRLYLAGALIAACEHGEPAASRRRSIVRMSDRPPIDDETEQALLRGWIDDVIGAITELAAPDDEGERRAPIHLIFFDRNQQRVLLEALGRHAATLLSATPLFDFVTQLAAFDSPVASFLNDEIRAHRNYPMVCQSLQSLAQYAKFDWNSPEPYRSLFRTRVFDYVGRFSEGVQPDGDADPWFTKQARFNTGIPLEYAYAAWGALEPDDKFKSAVDAGQLQRFQARRLEAIEHLAADLPANKYTQQRTFDLPNLASFEAKAGDLAQALLEFVTLERHAALGAWKSARLAPPERRVLAGDSLIVRYVETDQEPGRAEQNRDHLRRFEAANLIEKIPDVKRSIPPEMKWSHEGLRFRLRLESAGHEAPVNTLLARSSLSEGSFIVISPRFTVDERKPLAEQEPFAPTVRQLLTGCAANIERITISGEGVEQVGFVDVTMSGSRGAADAGFTFWHVPKPFHPGELYTLDEQADDITASRIKKVIQHLVDGERTAFYDRLAESGITIPHESVAARAAQERFMDGLRRVGELEPDFDFEPAKQSFIGELGDAPVVLVQGPPGTGKSYTTAYAILARMQAAMADNKPCRALISCKTHAAIDVLQEKVHLAIQNLKTIRLRYPMVFAAFFDERLLDVVLFRLDPRADPPSGIVPLGKPGKGELRTLQRIQNAPWCVAAATPGAIFKMLNDRAKQDGLCTQRFADLIVLDEASQMSLPEAIMAALPLKDEGQAIVVGDHRQMPPIVQHNWLQEHRRTFQEFRAYESVFVTLRNQTPREHWVQFQESFRIHEAMAEFLRREIYQQDGIAYFSRKKEILPETNASDDFVEAVLLPDHPMVVVVHDEAASQVRNEFEQALISPILRRLAERDGLGLGPREGLGVVVPHRAQRAALRESEPCLVERDPLTSAILVSAVDTVERFQGGEREVILISATESDRQYLLVNGEFVLDPRRLTVALSRAKKKLILVASRSVFELFSADDQAFANAQIWKNLLRQTCTTLLWKGEREGVRVVVHGNSLEDGGRVDVGDA